MTKILFAAALTFAASTAAFADSSALDTYDFPSNMGSASVDYTATASIGDRDGSNELNEFAVSPRAQ